MYHCIIAGGGPSGSRTAYGLARKGFKVLVLEEHGQFGIPVHCTGIVGSGMMESFGIVPSASEGSINSVTVHFPSGKAINLPTPIRPVLLNRRILDGNLAEMALEAGAEFRMNAKVLKAEQDRERVFVTLSNGTSGKEEVLTASMFVTATGAMCSLPFRCGLGRPACFYQSAQADVEIDGLEGIELFLGRHVAPGSFAYAVSTGKGLGKAGLIIRNGAGPAFSRFMDVLMASGRIRREPESPVFRPMPFGIPSTSVKGRIVSVGDAACQIKSTTGGGIYFGLICADMLVQIAGEFLEKGGARQDMLKKYDVSWKKSLKSEITAGLALRNYLQKLDDGWWDRLSLILEEKQVQELIRAHRDFDNHRKFIVDFFKIPSARSFIISSLSAELAGIIGFSDLLKNIARDGTEDSVPVR